MPRRTSKAELEFLRHYNANEFPHPSVSVDVALLTARGDALEPRLGQRFAH